MRYSSTEIARRDILWCVGCVVRFRILEFLYQRDNANVSFISREFREITRGVVSHHLGVLKSCGLVGSEKSGQFNLYKTTSFGEDVYRMVFDIEGLIVLENKEP